MARAGAAFAALTRARDGKGVCGMGKEAALGFARRHPLLIPCAVAAAMLAAVAVMRLRYDYQRALWWVVCAASIWVMVTAYRQDRVWAAVLFIGLVILFNPLFPFRLAPDVWRRIDLACAGVFLLAAIVATRKPREEKEP